MRIGGWDAQVFPTAKDPAHRGFSERSTPSGSHAGVPHLSGCGHLIVFVNRFIPLGIKSVIEYELVGGESFLNDEFMADVACWASS